MYSMPSTSLRRPRKPSSEPSLSHTRSTIASCVPGCEPQRNSPAPEYISASSSSHSSVVPCVRCGPRSTNDVCTRRFVAPSRLCINGSNGPNTSQCEFPCGPCGSSSPSPFSTTYAASSSSTSLS